MLQEKRRSLIKRTIRKLPLPLLAAIFGVLTAAAVWIVIDPIQTRAIGQIFGEELQERLDQQARESLLRFDSFLQSYTATTRLLANHRRMANYLEPVFWFPSDEDPPILYQNELPVWLSRNAFDGLLVQPRHVLLVDVRGKIREEYRLGNTALPADAQLEVKQAFADQREKVYLTRLNGRLYALASAKIEDASYYRMGSLVLLIPVDSQFLNASQQRTSSSQTAVAILDADSQLILSSSETGYFMQGENMENLREDYVVTAQSFYEYGESTLNLLFVTLISRDVVSATHNSTLVIERRHRLTGTAITAGIFVLLFILVSYRINRVLKRITSFSNRALDMTQSNPTGGNQLLIMEEWISGFIQTVRKARDEMRDKYTAEIMEREALKTAVLDASLDPIITIDQAGLIVDFNPTAEQTFGYGQQDAASQKLDKLVFATGSRDAFQGLLQDCLDGRTDTTSLRTLTAQGKDGRSFPVEVAIKPVMLAQRQLFTAYIRDISERKRQATEIVSLAAFPRESPMPVLRINSKGVVLYANNASSTLLDYWGCKRMQTLPIFWQRQVEEALQHGYSREKEVQTEHDIYTLLLVPVKNLDYVNIYGREISEVRRAEEEARYRQNELIHVSRLSTMGEMATGIAHELNQPLSAIVNFANGCSRRIKSGVGEPRDLLNAMDQISAQASRAGEIIKRLRSMVTRQQPVREDTDLNLLAAEVCALVAHDRKRMGIAIELRLSEKPLLSRVDPIQIEQVILNLLRNALDALQSQEPLRRRLQVRTGSVGSSTHFISVQDSGAGISPADMGQLFDPFFSTKETGMGMGLSISQTIIQEHNGKIRVESFPEKGSLFIIELPSSTMALETQS